MQSVRDVRDLWLVPCFCGLDVCHIAKREYLTNAVGMVNSNRLLLIRYELFFIFSLLRDVKMRFMFLSLTTTT